MSKSIIWNQLKALGYDSKQLKAVYDVSYQSASKELLESILASLEKEVGEGVNENLSSECGGDTVVSKNSPTTNDTVNQYQVLPLQTKFNHYSYFTLDNQLTYMRFGNEFHPVLVQLESKTVKDLITQEMHLLDDMFFTAFYGSPCNIQETVTTSDNVTIETNNNKGIGFYTVDLAYIFLLMLTEIVFKYSKQINLQ